MDPINSGNVSNNSDPYANAGNLFKTSQSSSSSVKSANSSSSVEVFGVGTVPVQPADIEINSELQAAWNKQMELLVDIMTRIKSPNPANPADLKELVAVLNELGNLAANGVTDENGNTSYVTYEMAEALDTMLQLFNIFGISADLDVNSLSAEQATALLTVLKEAGLSEGEMKDVNDALLEAIYQAGLHSSEDLGFQTYIYTTLMGMINAMAPDLKNLADYQDTANKTLDTLNTILGITTNTAVPKDIWKIDMNFDDPGDIPPGAAQGIQDYIVKEGGNDKEKGFLSQYNKDYEYASQQAKKNGTTVQEEMAKITYSPNSAEILREFIGKDGNEGKNRLNEVAKIVLNATVTEINLKADLPEGKTWTSIGIELLEATVDLKEQIEILKANDANPETIASLEKIVASVETIFNQACQKAGWGTSTMEEVIAAATATPPDKDAQNILYFTAFNFINKSQPGSQNATDLNNGVQRMSDLNTELLNEFKKLTTLLENLTKLLAQLLKMMDDSMKSYAKRM